MIAGGGYIFPCKQSLMSGFAYFSISWLSPENNSMLTADKITDFYVFLNNTRENYVPTLISY